MMKRLAKYNAVDGTVLVAASLLTAILVGWTGLAAVMTIGATVAVVGSYAAWLISDLD